MEKKLRVALDWTQDILFDEHLVQYLSERTHSMSRAELTMPLEDFARIEAAIGRLPVPLSTPQAESTKLSA
jgi:hypothetical protein